MEKQSAELASIGDTGGDVEYQTGKSLFEEPNPIYHSDRMDGDEMKYEFEYTDALVDLAIQFEEEDASDEIRKMATEILEERKLARDSSHETGRDF